MQLIIVVTSPHKTRDDVPSLAECAECAVTCTLQRFDHSHPPVAQRNIALPLGIARSHRLQLLPQPALTTY
jgi:hypothetical protein